jgi:CAAX prenyl protease-like protein
MTAPIQRDAFVRVAPFAVFMVLLWLRGLAPADGSWGIDPRWIYGVGVAAVGGLLLWWRREYGELFAQTWPSAREALLAAGVGFVVFVAWIQLDAPWMVIDLPAAPPFAATDAGGAIDWALVAVRWSGAALVVPVMEELFWRSFLMRWIQHPRFASVAPHQVGLRAVLLSTFVFTLAHTLWLAAALAGLAYAGLYLRSGRLWTAVIAHAVTNGALGVWVVATGRWQFW